jgi:hypothetical protein
VNAVGRTISGLRFCKELYVHVKRDAVCMPTTTIVIAQDGPHDPCTDTPLYRIVGTVEALASMETATIRYS